MSKAGGRVVSRAELSEFLAVDLTTVDGWIRRGCPMIERGGRGRAHSFNLAHVVGWLRDTARSSSAEGAAAISLDEARQRKTAAEAELAELELGHARGELVQIDTVAELLEATLSTVRLRLLGVPAKVAARLAPVRTPAKCRRILEDEFSDVLNEIVGGDEVASRVVRRDGEKRARKGDRRRSGAGAPASA